MFKFDFSETKSDWVRIKEGVSGQWKQKAVLKFRLFLQPLFDKLDFKEAVFWFIFFTVSLFSTAVILRFIDSFSREQDKYQTILTSVGRSHLTGDDLISASTTKAQ